MGSKLTSADRREVDTLYGALCTAHPKTFVHPVLKGRGMLPLKIGIYEDLLARYPDVRPKILKAFIQQYVKTSWYLRCSTVAGNSRVDLDGELVSRLSEEQAKYARAEQAKSLKKKEALVALDDGLAQCRTTGKIRFEHEGLAMDAAAATMARKGRGASPVRTYRCPHCHGFHWGHYRVEDEKSGRS